MAMRFPFLSMSNTDLVPGALNTVFIFVFVPLPASKTLFSQKFTAPSVGPSWESLRTTPLPLQPKLRQVQRPTSERGALGSGTPRCLKAQVPESSSPPFNSGPHVLSTYFSASPCWVLEVSTDEETPSPYPLHTHTPTKVTASFRSQTNTSNCFTRQVGIAVITPSAPRNQRRGKINSQSEGSEET